MLDSDYNSKGLSSINSNTENKTIIVKNINSDSNIDELEHLFNKFGVVNKVTFICDKYNGQFKGYILLTQYCIC
jgi:RNA recognition motif-containing protein